MRTNVLVTGAGGPAGVAVIRALSGAGHGVVAVDADPLAAGLHLAERSAVIPTGDDPRFANVLTDIVRTTQATVVVSTVAEEIDALHDIRGVLTESGAAVWFPPREAAARCIDKWTFAKTLADAGLPHPSTALGAVDDVPGPWIVKPRFGRGSRDIYAVDSEAELEWAIRRVKEPLVQTEVSGREFTVDALVDRDGRLAGAVPRWRLATRGGVSTCGRTFSSHRLVGLVGRVLDTVGIEGPANVQGFARPDGAFVVTEVNPRFSGGLPLSLAAGADLVGEYVRGALGLPVRPEWLGFRAGVTMTRHFEEVFEG